MTEKLILFPVITWEVGTIAEYDGAFIRPAFLAHALQKDAEADPGRRYLWSRAQLKRLNIQIAEAIHRLETNPAPPDTREVH